MSTRVLIKMSQRVQICKVQLHLNHLQSRSHCVSKPEPAVGNIAFVLSCSLALQFTSNDAGTAAVSLRGWTSGEENRAAV